MNIRNFALSFYGNAVNGIHIQKIDKPREAKELHTHAYYQIYYVEKGALTHFVEDRSSKLIAGDVFIIPPDVIHKIDDNEGVCFYSLSFMPELINEFSHTASFAAAFLQRIVKDTVRPKITVPPDEQLRIRQIIENIFFEFDNGLLAAGETVKLYIALLLTVFARIYVSNQDERLLSDNKDKNYLILYCIDYIKLNFFKKITLRDMLSLSTMSRSEFCKRFREIAGHTFNEYLNKCRVERACDLIRRGNKISTVYSFCGYEDNSTFYRNFVKIMGVSPSKYKTENE